MKMWKIEYTLSSGKVIFDITKAANVQRALIEWGSNFTLPSYSKDEVEKIVIVEVKNSKQL